MKKNNLNHFLGGIAALCFLYLILYCPEQSANGIYQGMVSCAKQVIPALFPFFVVSNLIIINPLLDWLGMLLYPYTRFCLGIHDRRACTALLVSWLGGFAVASATISQLYFQHRVNRRQADLLLVCGVGSGPAFVINTVGLLLLHNIKLGAFLYFALLCANLLTGIFLRAIFCFCKESDVLKNKDSFSSNTTAPPGASCNGFVDAVTKAVRSMLTVCGFVIFFRFLCTTIPFAFHLSKSTAFLTSALLEVTSGCTCAARFRGINSVFACCGALSLQSLSVFLQVRALLCPELSLRSLLLVRPIHLAFSFLFLRLFLSFSSDSLSVFSSLAPQIIPTTHTSPDAAFVLFFLCCATLHQLEHTRNRVLRLQKKI